MSRLGLAAAIVGLSGGAGWGPRVPEVVDKLRPVPLPEKPFKPLPEDSELRQPLLAGRCNKKKSRAKRKAGK